MIKRLLLHCDFCNRDIEITGETPPPRVTCDSCGRKYAKDDSTSLSVAGSGGESAIYRLVAGDNESQSLIGDYELLGEIARGGMGVVYRARQRSLNRTVALKMIRAGDTASVEELQRFLAEAEAAARLDHPHIVPIFEVREDGGRHYFSMGYVDGPSLAKQLEGGPLPVRQAVEWIKKVTDAVQYAHDHGIIHRDLKPSNILIDSTGEPRVTDFGLAKLIDADSELTTSGQVLGTPSYMPPEQATGNLADVDPRSDVYAIGGVLYAALTGRPPFQAASLLETLRQVVEREPVSPRQLNPSVPRDLETICTKCLQKSPAARYDSAAEVSAELDRFLNGQPIEARPVGRVERAWRWCRREPLVAAALGTTMAVLLIATVVSSISLLWTTSALRAEASERQRATAREQEANSARRSAEQASARADKSSRAASLAKSVALDSLDASERSDYRNRIRLADEAIKINDVPAAKAHLAACPIPLREFEWRYLTQQLETANHTWEIGKSAARFIPGTPEIVALQYGELQFCNATNGNVTAVKETSGHVLEDVRISPDGKHFTTLSVKHDEEWAITIWDLASRTSLRTLTFPFMHVRGLWHVNPTTVAVSGLVGTTPHVMIIDLQSGLETHRFEMGLRDEAIAVHPDSRRIAFVAKVSKNATAIVMADFHAGDAVLVRTGFSGRGVEKLAFCYGGGGLLIVDDSGCRVVDLTTREEIVKLDDGVATAEMSPDQSKLAVASRTGEIRVYGLPELEPLRTIHANALEELHIQREPLEFDHTGQRLLCASDGLLQVWELDQQRDTLVHEGAGGHSLVRADDRYVVIDRSAGAGSEIRWHDWSTGEATARVKIDKLPYRSDHAVNAVGTVAIVDQKNSVAIWEPGGNEPVFRTPVMLADQFDATEWEVTAVALAAEQPKLAVGFANGQLHLWNYESGKLETKLEVKRGFRIASLVIDHNHKTWIAVGILSDVLVWDGKQPAREVGVEGDRLVASADRRIIAAMKRGTTLITGAHQDTVAFLDVESEHVIGAIAADPGDRHLSLDFNTAGSRCAVLQGPNERLRSGKSRGNRLTFFDIPSFERLLTIDGVWVAAFAILAGRQRTCQLSIQ